MRLSDTPPVGWDDRIAFPLQSVGYARAAAAVGHRPLFAEDESGIALVLVRQVPVPVLRAWTARARVYAHARGPFFLAALVERLRAAGVSYVKLGDTMWGAGGLLPEIRSLIRRVTYHVLINDLRPGEEAALARAYRMRQLIGKASAETTVAEVRTAADLRDYLSLVDQTAQRLRLCDQAAVYPAAYFETIVREMVPRRQAVLFLARAGDRPVAGGAFLISPDRFVYLHGCSTRDRALTPKQGPTAIFWHALRVACAEGCAFLDMGPVTPTDDPSHPHYSVYVYKKRWGGDLTEVEGAELLLSPWKCRLQESLLAPMWDRLHPVYLRLFGENMAASPSRGNGYARVNA